MQKKSHKNDELRKLREENLTLREELQKLLQEIKQLKEQNCGIIHAEFF